MRASVGSGRARAGRCALGRPEVVDRVLDTDIPDEVADQRLPRSAVRAERSIAFVLLFFFLFVSEVLVAKKQKKWRTKLKTINTGLYDKELEQPDS